MINFIYCFVRGSCINYTKSLGKAPLKFKHGRALLNPIKLRDIITHIPLKLNVGIGQLYQCRGCRAVDVNTSNHTVNSVQDSLVRDLFTEPLWK